MTVKGIIQLLYSLLYLRITNNTQNNVLGLKECSHKCLHSIVFLTIQRWFYFGIQLNSCFDRWSTI